VINYICKFVKLIMNVRRETGQERRGNPLEEAIKRCSANFDTKISNEDGVEGKLSAKEAIEVLRTSDKNSSEYQEASEALKMWVLGNENSYDGRDTPRQVLPILLDQLEIDRIKV
jgi:hypothetical protein